MPRHAKNPVDPAPIPAASDGESYIPAIDKLPIRQAAFVKALVSPDSPTYGLQGPSYQAVYQNGSAGAAAVRAHVAVRQSNTALAIREEIERQGLGSEVRIGTIKDVLQGRHRARAVTTSRRSEDGTVETTTESTPRAQDVLKAVALLDRLDGSDAARGAEAHARAGVLRDLTKRIMAGMDKHGGRTDRATGQEEALEGTEGSDPG